MKSSMCLSLDVDLAIKAKEHAEIRGISLSRLVSLSLIGEIERYEALSPELKAEALVSRPGRQALSTEEFAERAVARQNAIRELRRKNKELPKGKTLDEMDEDEAPKKDPFFLAGVDDDPFLKELERQAMIEHGLTPPTGKPDE